MARERMGARLQRAAVRRRRGGWHGTPARHGAPRRPCELQSARAALSDGRAPDGGWKGDAPRVAPRKRRRSARARGHARSLLCLPRRRRSHGGARVCDRDVTVDSRGARESHRRHAVLRGCELRHRWHLGLGSQARPVGKERRVHDAAGRLDARPGRARARLRTIGAAGGRREREGAREARHKAHGGWTSHRARKARIRLPRGRAAAAGEPPVSGCRGLLQSDWPHAEAGRDGVDGGSVRAGRCGRVAAARSGERRRAARHRERGEPRHGAMNFA